MYLFRVIRNGYAKSYSGHYYEQLLPWDKTPDNEKKISWSIHFVGCYWNFSMFLLLIFYFDCEFFSKSFSKWRVLWSANGLYASFTVCPVVSTRIQPVSGFEPFVCRIKSKVQSRFLCEYFTHFSDAMSEISKTCVLFFSVYSKTQQWDKARRRVKENTGSLAP